MTLLFNKKSALALALIATLSTGTIAVADPFPPQPQSEHPNVFAGTTVPLYGVNGISPYGYITQQDMASVMAGFGLTNIAKPVPVPFNVAPPDASGSSLPNIKADDPVSLAIGSMLVSISQDNVKQYLANADAAFEAPNKNLSATSSYAGSNILNIKSPDSNTSDYTAAFVAPYNIASLFNYTPPSGKDGDPAAYRNNPGNVYISLASGALTPVYSPSDKAGSPPSPDYMIQLRRIAAIQSAGVYALNEILKRNEPLNGANAALYSALSNNTFPKGNAQNQPITEHELEKYMATRRLDPNSGWYSHVQQASPVELQREQLYMQAEMLYELYQLHHTQEVNQALLAVSLLSQNYTNRAYLNQQAVQSDPSKQFSK